MKRTLILPALLALAACSQSPAENFAKAQAAFARHDYAAARVLVASALAAQPADKAMLLLQARTLIALGDGEGAGTALDQLAGGAAPQGELAELSAEAALLRRSPDTALTLLGQLATPEAERLRALAAIQREKLPEAGEHFASAVKAGGNPRVFADYARFKLLNGDVAGAQELARRAAEAAPDGLDTLLVQGQLAVCAGDLAAALERYQRAVKLFPNSQTALLGAAATLGDLGRIDEAAPLVRALAGFAPRSLDVVFLEARLAASRKDWAGVRQAVQKVEAELPKVHPLRLFYGESLVRLGQSELAIAQLLPVAHAQPGNRQAVLLLAEAQLAAGDAAAAAATLRPIADQPGARPAELALMARAAKASGDPKAGQYEARSKAPTPQVLGSDLAEADAAMRGGNWARAVVAYDRILAATDGKNVLVLNNAAYAHLMLGNADKARGFADRALKLAPNNPSVLDTAGWVRFKSGKDLDEAGRLLRLAAEKAPGNLTIRAHLAEAGHAR